ncbi:hypothetical protein TNIN_83851 [Trichonephila inaurata madagascariensis]|uniref:Uncharacterized protein n=1 Tax=Trichonephila inaurata madagascariensis TaxID=2747483 RepID=A0A8X6WXQ1_9ARAC|nr:hypothetical protein TNIN_83851 [Trichonephila inaurata madagascariensis]
MSTSTLKSENFSKVVILSNSRAALLATSSESTVSVDILNIHLANNDLIENHKKVALQSVSAHSSTHCAAHLHENGTVDSLASKISQISDEPIPFYTTKRFIKKSFTDAYWRNIKETNKDKKLIEEIVNIPSWPRDKFVAVYPLAIGPRLSLQTFISYKNMSSPLFQLCYIREEMGKIGPGCSSSFVAGCSSYFFSLFYNSFNVCISVYSCLLICCLKLKNTLRE